MRSVDFRLFLALALAVPACSSDGPRAVPAAPADLPASGCPAGFASDGTVCLPTAPEHCPEGSAAFIGTSVCEPIGTGPCPDAFNRHPLGYGCVDHAPTAKCARGSRQSVRATEGCVPIGDCAAAFPPSGATFFVDDTFPESALDGAHVRTLTEAVNAAPEGAIIAVEEGTYRESVKLVRPVTLAGRCASKVLIEPNLRRVPGIHAMGIKDVHIRGVSIRGAEQGIDLRGGSAADVRDTLIEAPIGAGFFVEASTLEVRGSMVTGAVPLDGSEGWGVGAGLASQVLVEDSALVGGANGVYAASAGTTLTVRASVVTGQAPAGASRPSGAVSVDGAKVVVERSVFRDMAADAAVVATDYGSLELRDSVVRNIKYPNVKAYGHGALAYEGGDLKITRSSILDVASMAVLAKGAGVKFAIDSVYVHGPRDNEARIVVRSDVDVALEDAGSGAGFYFAESASGSVTGAVIDSPWLVGIQVASQSKLAISRTLVRNVRPQPVEELNTALGSGLLATGDSRVEADQVSIQQATFAAVSVGRNASLVAKRLLVRDTEPGLPSTVGAGLMVSAGATADISESAIDRSASVAVLMPLANGSVLKMSRSTIMRTSPGLKAFGQAITLWNRAQAQLTDVHIADNALAALVVENSGARLKHCVIARNPVALHVQGDVKFLESNDEVDSDAEVRVSSDTVFVGNETRLGSGLVPIPMVE